LKLSWLLSCQTCEDSCVCGSDDKNNNDDDDDDDDNNNNNNSNNNNNNSIQPSSETH
jgi:hypothetical protein